MPPTKMTAAEFQTWRRDTLRLTQRTCARAIGVTKRAVQGWEQGERKVPYYAIKSLEMHAKLDRAEK